VASNKHMPQISEFKHFSSVEYNSAMKMHTIHFNKSEKSIKLTTLNAPTLGIGSDGAI
jgi:hypothetical protein